MPFIKTVREDSQTLQVSAPLCIFAYRRIRVTFFSNQNTCCDYLESMMIFSCEKISNHNVKYCYQVEHQQLYCNIFQQNNSRKKIVNHMNKN